MLVPGAQYPRIRGGFFKSGLCKKPGMLARSAGLFLLIIFAAISGFSANRCLDCQTVDFGKRLQVALIRPLFSMSIHEKIKYLQKFGLKVYQVPDPLLGQVRLGFLPKVPLTENPGLNPFYKLFADEGILGLYLTPSNIGNSVDHPTILFVESADDWTIIHEFCHFLFDRARTMENPYDESRELNNLADAKTDFFETWGAFRQDQSFANVNQSIHFAESFVVFADLQRKFLINVSLEESTVEKLIRDNYRHKKLAKYELENFKRSETYIRNTSRKAQVTLDVMLATCDDVQKALAESDRVLLENVKSTCAAAAKLKRQDLDLLKSQRIRLD
jgi:hypothetical protein